MLVKSTRMQQSFSPMVDKYIFNPATRQLEKLEVQEDRQAYIDSFIDVSLNCMLEKFLPKDVKDVDEVADYTDTVFDLAALGEAFDIAEDYRDKYELDDKMSIKDIYNFVGNQAKQLKDKINSLKKNDKEVVNNEEIKA